MKVSNTLKHVWIKLVKGEISVLHELIMSSFKKLETLPGGF